MVPKRGSLQNEENFFWFPEEPFKELFLVRDQNLQDIHIKVLGGTTEEPSLQ